MKLTLTSSGSTNEKSGNSTHLHHAYRSKTAVDRQILKKIGMSLFNWSLLPVWVPFCLLLYHSWQISEQFLLYTFRLIDLLHATHAPILIYSFIWYFYSICVIFGFSFFKSLRACSEKKQLTCQHVMTSLHNMPSHKFIKQAVELTQHLDHYKLPS